MKVIEKYNQICTVATVKSASYMQKHANLVLFTFGIVLIYGAGADIAHAGRGTYADACNGLLSLVEGTFGAMLTAAAGVAAIIAAAVGGFKFAWSLLVVAVGSFILRSFITLFNGDCGTVAT